VLPVVPQKLTPKAQVMANDSSRSAAGPDEFDLSVLRDNLLPPDFVFEGSEVWDHSQLFQKVLSEINP